MAENIGAAPSSSKPQTPAQPTQTQKPPGATSDKGPRQEDTGTHLQERIQEIGTQVRDWAGDVGTQVKQGAQGAIEQVSTSAAQLSQQGRTVAGQMEKTLQETIREKPLQSVLVAAGIGVVIGLLCKR